VVEEQRRAGVHRGYAGHLVVRELEVEDVDVLAHPLGADGLGDDHDVALDEPEAGRNPYDRALTDLVGELSTRSEPFRKWWAAHNVRYHQTGRKRLHHPTVGDLELDYEVMQLSADSGLLLAVFSAEPGSRSAEALDLLASWTATPVIADDVATPRERTTDSN
jgi:hypothetical protein